MLQFLCGSSPLFFFFTPDANRFLSPLLKSFARLYAPPFFFSPVPSSQVSPFSSSLFFSYTYTFDNLLAAPLNGLTFVSSFCSRLPHRLLLFLPTVRRLFPPPLLLRQESLSVVPFLLDAELPKAFSNLISLIPHVFHLSFFFPLSSCP